MAQLQKRDKQFSSLKLKMDLQTGVCKSIFNLRLLKSRNKSLILRGYEWNVARPLGRDNRDLKVALRFIHTAKILLGQAVPLLKQDINPQTIPPQNTPLPPRLSTPTA
jgi:hypothetical protein